VAITIDVIKKYLEQLGLGYTDIKENLVALRIKVVDDIQLTITFSLEEYISHCQHLIKYEDFRIYMYGDSKTEP
jgi:hypothetical protein